MSNIKESDYEQEDMEFLGEYPVIPQWEEVETTIILDTTETPSTYPYLSGFEKDMIDGFI